MENNGKRFENNLKKSVPEDILYYRFKDGTANWQHNDLVRFQTKNICDCMLYDGDILIFLELKNHKGKSLPFSCIRKNQLEELSLKQYYKNVKCGLLINFEDVEQCFYMNIRSITDFIRKSDRQSIPISYCRENGVKIEIKKLRTNFKYDVKKMIENIKEIH